MSIARYEFYDNIGSMYELCSYYDGGFIMNELCSYISCMTFIMIPRAAAVEHVAAPVEPVVAPVDKDSSPSEAPVALPFLLA